MLQKYILVVMSILSGFILRSQNNSLVIFSTNGTLFLLNVDGAAINTTPQCNVKAFDLAQGRHVIRISIPSSTVSIKDSVVFVNEPKYFNKEFTYALTQTSKTFSLDFKSVSELSGPLTPPVPEAPKEKAPVVDNSIYGHLYQAKNNKPVFFQNYNAESSSCTTALNEQDMGYGLRLLKTINDEERQISYAKTIIQNNCYTVAQLQQLLLTFPSEIDRMNLAKAAYTHLSDKQNVAQLYPAFKYQTIKDSYTAYVQEQENLLNQKRMQCTQAADAPHFEQLYSKIKNGGYENEKLAVAKKALASVCLSTEQAQKIALIFVHDREKLECLKYAYAIIVDKEQSKKLAELFQFSENKQNFLNFISNQ